MLTPPAETVPEAKPTPPPAATRPEPTNDDDPGSERAEPGTFPEKFGASPGNDGGFAGAVDDEDLPSAVREAKRAATPAEPPRRAAASPDTVASSDPEPKTAWFTRLRKGLARSAEQFTAPITALVTKKKLDEDTLQDLEDLLVRADLGVDTATAITDRLAAERMGRDVSDAEVRGVMADEIEKVLAPVAAELELDLDHTPHVMLMIGVNGSGKTTTIGKLSQKLYDAGFSTVLVAGDTFRAAAVEQLEIWGARTNSPVVSSAVGADAAGLAYDAVEQARRDGVDVVLIDTAGRLQNRAELMDELAKVVRVIRKVDPTAPHDSLLVLDATVGQNALSQAEAFLETAGTTGLVMTKLDGTARGGVLVALGERFGLPIHYVGVGEAVEDLQVFDADAFANALSSAGTKAPEAA